MKVYDDGRVALHRGDCARVLRRIALPDPKDVVIVTDPPWPNAPQRMLDEWSIADVDALLRQTLPLFARLCRKLVIVFGGTTDPRVLRYVPSTMPFFTQITLGYTIPSRAGTAMNFGDVAYVFGDHAAAAGRKLVPGRFITGRAWGRPPYGQVPNHPCPRNPDHCAMIVRHLVRPTDTVIDPFCGAGVIVAAAKAAGNAAIGVDRSADYLEEARKLLRQDVLPHMLDETDGEKRARLMAIGRESRSGDVIRQVARLVPEGQEPIPFS